MGGNIGSQRMEFQTEAFDLGTVDLGAGNNRVVAALSKTQGEGYAWVQIA